METMIKIPNVLKETVRGLEVVSIDDDMMRRREIFLTSGVDAASSAILIKQLMYLERESPGEPITLYISSPGGEVVSGLAVYDYIRIMESPVNTVCIGTAASMGAILFLAGEERKMMPHTKVMIHDPSYANYGGTGEKPLEIKQKLDSLMNVRKILAEIISERTGMSMRQVYSKTKTDTYLSAKEALRLNVATEIIS